MTSTLNTRPIDTSYDAGNDIQPGVSWANPNKDSYPASDVTMVKTTTVTKTKVTANNPKTAGVQQDASVESSLEKNQIPMDKEDPTRRTKALPFANADSTEIRTQIQSEEFQTRKSSSAESHNDSDLIDNYSELHNGNILDRTMDQIRSWVHSFKNGETQYEEVEVDDHHDNNGPSTMDNAKSQLNATKDTVTAKASQLANSTKDSLSSMANSTTDTMNVAGNKLNNIKDTVMHTVNDYTHSVSETMNSAVKNVGPLKETVTTRANELAHTLSDTASSTLNTVKSSVNEYIAPYQSSPNESLSTTVSNTISNTLPTQTQLKTLSSNYLPPLMQQASSSYAFLGSFVTNYLMTYQDFFLMLRKQSLPLQMFTVMMFVTHFVLPWFFLDKSAARSVLYCYFIASVLSHGTFFISRSLRYMFLSHLVFVPMLISLTLHQGFSEAGDVSQLIDSFHNGEKVHTMFAAPLSLRSYLFILWLRVVLMNQATMFTLDLVNLSNMLGLSLETQRGQEGKLISSRVKVFRKKLAQNIHGAAQSIEESGESNNNNVNNNGQRSRRNSNSKYSPAFKSSNLSANVNNGNNNVKTSPQSSNRSLSPQPQQQQTQQHQQKWIKKDGNDSQTVQTKEFTVESHEKPQHTELRQRTVQQTKQTTM